MAWTKWLIAPEQLVMGPGGWSFKGTRTGDSRGWLVGEAGFAVDVKLETVSYNLAGDLVAKGPHEIFDIGGPELAHVATLDANGVMVVLNAGKAVPGGAVHHVKAAQNAGVQQQFDGAKHGSAADARQFVANLFRCEALFLPFQKLDDGPSGGGCPVATILQDRHYLGASCKRNCHILQPRCLYQNGGIREGAS